MTEQTHNHNGHDNHEEASPISVVIWGMRKPIPDGIYEVIVTDPFKTQAPDGREILVVGLTAPDRTDRGPHFAAIVPLDDSDESRFARRVASAILRRRITNGNFNERFGILERQIKVRVRRGKRRKRVIDIVPRCWDGGTIDYAQLTEFVPPDDIEYWW